MSKYVNNTLLALQISAINELSKISKNLSNVNFSKIIEIFTDHRWSNCKKNNAPSILDYLTAQVLEVVVFQKICWLYHHNHWN